MQQKVILVLSGTLILLLGIAWLSGVFDQNPTNIQLPELDIPMDEVTYLRIELPDGTLELEQQTNQWYVRQPVDMLADSSTVARTLDDLSTMTLNNLATRNLDRHGIYGIDSTASVVTLAWPGGSEKITISRQGRDFASIYVRLDDDSEVYSTNGRVTLNQDPERWRNRMVVNTGMGAVTSARVTRLDSSYEVELVDDVWMVDGQAADSLKVTSWLRRFSPLNADGFFDDLPSAILSDASYRVDLSTSTNTTVSLQATPAESAVALVSGGNQFTYKVFESRLDQIFPELESLLVE